MRKALTAPGASPGRRRARARSSRTPATASCGVPERPETENPSPRGTEISIPVPSCAETYKFDHGGRSRRPTKSKCFPEPARQEQDRSQGPLSPADQRTHPSHSAGTPTVCGKSAVPARGGLRFLPFDETLRPSRKVRHDTISGVGVPRKNVTVNLNAPRRQ